MNIQRKLGILLSGSVLVPFWAVEVQAQSIVPEMNGTGTVVAPLGNQFDIRGGQLSGDGANLFHSFERFGLTAGQSATFWANPQIQNILGRVVGGQASNIDGLIRVLGGNSNLFLMNPSGILFGANAQLNLPAAFTATTATGVGFGGQWFSASGGNDYARLLGNPDALAFTLTQPGAIANFGNLTVGEGQALTLAGGAVLSAGRLAAPGGTVTVSAIAGNQVARISTAGSVLSLEVPLAGSQPQGWTLPVQTLPQLLAGNGMSDANTVIVQPDGAIRLVSSGKQVAGDVGTTIVTGTIDVANAGAGKSGGLVTVTGDRVGLVGASVDASGAAGGGAVRIGGEFQGRGMIPNAALTYVDSGSRIRVDALEQGNGGRAIFWGDRSTVFSGNVSVRGAGQGGNGGFVEISGRDSLSFDGRVDLTAPLGEGGQVLFDPRDITILDGFGANDSDFTLNNNQIFAADGGNTDFIIGAATLQGIIGGGPITLAASGDINLNSPLTFAGQSGPQINFIAGNNFNGVGQDITAPGRSVSITAFGTTGIRIGNIDTSSVAFNAAASNGGSVTLRAANGSITTGKIQTQSQSCPIAGCMQPHGSNLGQGLNSLNGGNIQLDASGNINTQALYSFSESFIGGTGNAGNITITSSSGSVNITSTDSSQILAFSLADGGNSGSGGAITINSQGPITIARQGTITLSDVQSRSVSWLAGAQSGNGGNISLQSNGGSIRVGTVTADSGVERGGNTGNAGAVTLSSLGDITANQVSSVTQVNSPNGNIAGNSGIAGNGGDIQVISRIGNIDIQGLQIASWSRVIGNGNTGNAGAVTLESSQGSIRTPQINAFSEVLGNATSARQIGDGGKIVIASSGTIIAGYLTSASKVGRDPTFNNGEALQISDGNAGNAGSISLRSSAGSITAGGANAISQVTGNGTSGLGGTYTLIANSDVRIDNRLNTFSEVKGLGTSGNGGDVLISSSGSIFSQRGVDASSKVVRQGISSRGGSITLNSQSGIRIDSQDSSTDGLISVSSASKESGDGGAVSLSANSGNVSLAFIDTYSGASEGKAQDGGQVQISAPQGNVLVSRKINSFSNGAVSSGNGQDIRIQASGDIVVPNGLFTFSQFNSDPNSVTTSGDINLVSTRGGIRVGAIEAFTIGQSNSPVRSGNVTLTAKTQIETQEIYTASQGSRSEGGSVVIRTPDGLFKSNGVRTTGFSSCLGSSICTIGNLNGGTVTITHGGGPKGIPFTMGMASENGTRGNIRTNELSLLGSINGSYISPEKSIKIFSPAPSTLPEKIFDTPDKLFNPNILIPPLPPSDIVVPEEKFTQEMRDYLGDEKKTKSIKEIKKVLQDIRKKTKGMNVALVYLYRDCKSGSNSACKNDKDSWLTVDVITADMNSDNSDRPKIEGVHPDLVRIKGRIDSYSSVVEMARRFSKRVKVSSSERDKPFPSRRPKLEFILKPGEKEKYEIKIKNTSFAVKPVHDTAAQQQPIRRYPLEDESQELYDSIIRLFEYLLTPKDKKNKITHVAFIAEPGLRTVPFSGFHDGMQFLMEEYSVGLMPSFSHLNIEHKEGIDKASIFAMGSNEFPPDPTIEKDDALQEIPSIEDDLETLIRENGLPSNSGDQTKKPFLGEDFTLKNLQSERGQSSIVHLSTHAEFRIGPMKESYIYFREGKHGRKVSLSDIPNAKMELSPEVELAFLAACQTAEGGEGSAELGFSGAFIQAKVKSVIASLWKVRYRETYAFTMEFYNQLRHPPSAPSQNTKAAALQRTQKALRDGTVYMKDGKLHLSFGKVIPLSKEFPADPEKEIKFTEAGDWAGLTIVGSPW